MFSIGRGYVLTLTINTCLYTKPGRNLTRCASEDTP